MTGGLEAAAEAEACLPWAGPAVTCDFLSLEGRLQMSPVGPKRPLVTPRKLANRRKRISQLILNFVPKKTGEGCGGRWLHRKQITRQWLQI